MQRLTSAFCLFWCPRSWTAVALLVAVYGLSLAHAPPAGGATMTSTCHEGTLVFPAFAMRQSAGTSPSELESKLVLEPRNGVAAVSFSVPVMLLV